MQTTMEQRGEQKVWKRKTYQTVFVIEIDFTENVQMSAGNLNANNHA
jgi:hypothetical protein